QHLPEALRVNPADTRALPGLAHADIGRARGAFVAGLWGPAADAALARIASAARAAGAAAGVLPGVHRHRRRVALAAGGFGRGAAGVRVARAAVVLGVRVRLRDAVPGPALITAVRTVAVLLARGRVVALAVHAASEPQEAQHDEARVAELRPDGRAPAHK